MGKGLKSELLLLTPKTHFVNVPKKCYCCRHKYYFTGIMTEENDQVTSKKEETVVTTDSPPSTQLIIMQLRKENSHLIKQRNELLKLLFQKDSIIERLSSDNKLLEAHFKTVVSEKFDKSLGI